MLDLVEEIQSYSPQAPSSKSNNLYKTEPQYFKPTPELKEVLAPASQQPEAEQTAKETGISRFCKQKYYEEYFKVNEQNVEDRLRAALVPPYNGQFLENIKPNPDFYGPFWIYTTLVILLGIVGNFANYFLSKFSDGDIWKGYFFKLELVRYAITLVFSFGAGVPVILFFMLKFMKCNPLSFPQISCLYGYSMTCYIPALIVCIIPLNFLQWILMVYAFVNSNLFLFANLRNYEADKAKFTTIMVSLVCMQTVFFLVCKFVFISLLGVSS